MIGRFLHQEQHSYAFATMVSVGLNLLLQSLAMYYQNRSKPFSKMLKELLLVFSLIKLGVDVYRLRRDESILEEGYVADLGAEMTITQVLELVTESVP